MTKVSKRPKWVLGTCICPWGRNRALFRSTIDGFRDDAIEVSILVAILDFSKHLKMAKIVFWEIAYCPWGRNRAPCRSTRDSFRDNGKRSFGQMATVQNLKIRNFRAIQMNTHYMYMHFVPLDLGNEFRPLSQTSWSGFRDIELDSQKTPKKAI